MKGKNLKLDRRGFDLCRAVCTYVNDDYMTELEFDNIEVKELTSKLQEGQKKLKELIDDIISQAKSEDRRYE